MQEYGLRKSEVLEQLNQQSWEDMDKMLPEIPTGVYTFTPGIDDLVYYRRLLYCLNQQQQSQRAFILTSYILSHNTNNYYALMLRSECLKKILAKCANPSQYEQTLGKELHFASCLLNLNPKQYQIWNYKKDLISCKGVKDFGIDMQKLLKIEEEFIFYLMTNDDEKNYHAWDYKTWLSRRSGDLEARIKQTQSMLFFNASNGQFQCQTLWNKCYSCWSYRFNLIKDLPEQKRTQFWEQESARIMDFLVHHPYHECAWNYLEGLIQTSELPDKSKSDIIKTVYNWCWTTKVNNRFAWSLVLHVGEKQMRKEALMKLQAIDPIRQLYYGFLQEST